MRYLLGLQRWFKRGLQMKEIMVDMAWVKSWRELQSQLLKKEMMMYKLLRTLGEKMFKVRDGGVSEKDATERRISLILSSSTLNQNQTSQ